MGLESLRCGCRQWNEIRGTKVSAVYVRQPTRKEKTRSVRTRENGAKPSSLWWLTTRSRPASGGASSSSLGRRQYMSAWFHDPSNRTRRALSLSLFPFPSPSLSSVLICKLLSFQSAVLNSQSSFDTCTRGEMKRFVYLLCAGYRQIDGDWFEIPDM